MLKCDMCGKELPQIKSLFKKQDEIKYQTITLNRKIIDLCDDCVTKFLKTMKK